MEGPNRVSYRSSASLLPYGRFGCSYLVFGEIVSANFKSSRFVIANSLSLCWPLGQICFRRASHLYSWGLPTPCYTISLPANCLCFTRRVCSSPLGQKTEEQRLRVSKAVWLISRRPRPRPRRCRFYHTLWRLSCYAGPVEIKVEWITSANSWNLAEISTRNRVKTITSFAAQDFCAALHLTR